MGAAYQQLDETLVTNSMPLFTLLNQSCCQLRPTWLKAREKAITCGTPGIKSYMSSSYPTPRLYPEMRNALSIHCTYKCFLATSSTVIPDCK